MTKNGVTLKPATLSRTEQNLVNTATNTLAGQGKTVVAVTRDADSPVLSLIIDSDKPYHVVGAHIYPSGRTAADKFEFFS
jgi:hypothetical protein